MLCSFGSKICSEK